MPKILVHHDHELREFDFNGNQSLLNILSLNHFYVSAPCGGHGTCGKCRVRVKKLGVLSACQYYPDEDIEVYLPDKQEARVLTVQYQNTLQLALQPGVLPHAVSSPIGLAVDVGTTSIVFYWLNLKTGSIMKIIGFANPQAQYGADVISRIQYCNSAQGLKTLQSEIIVAINKQIDIFVKKEGVARDQIVKISVAGNTTMLHILLGVDPSSIALAPFKPRFTEGQSVKARDLGIRIDDQAFLHLLPSISAFVGADILAGLASIAPSEKVENYLFIDIGTNGEMALVTPTKIFCCATAAGPAFEGANITCGMGAFDGAITSFNAEGYQTVSHKKAVGICGSGLIDIIANLLDWELISKDGCLEKEYVVVGKNEASTGEAIVITPQDVREVQLAKSAIASGIKILLQTAGLTIDEIDVLYLAGGFGNYLTTESATRIGMLPSELSHKIIPVGNASGTGAVLHLQSESFNEVLDSTLSRMEYVELSNHPDFELEFVMNMYF